MSYQLTYEDGSDNPPVVAKMHQWTLVRRKKPVLELDDSLEPMLDLIIITLIYMETRRRDAEAATAAAA